MEVMGGDFFFEFVGELLCVGSYFLENKLSFILRSYRLHVTKVTASVAFTSCNIIEHGF
jgi:hypothetical protein